MPAVPPIHTRWKPGQSGNPSGLKKGMLTVDQVRTVMSKFCTMDAAQLDAFMKAPTGSVLEKMVASVMLRAIKDGDASRLSFLLDRSVGKVTDVVENINHNFDEELERVPRENILELLRKAGNDK